MIGYRATAGAVVSVVVASLTTPLTTIILGVGTLIRTIFLAFISPRHYCSFLCLMNPPQDRLNRNQDDRLGILVTVGVVFDVEFLDFFTCIIVVDNNRRVIAMLIGKFLHLVDDILNGLH